MSRIDDLIQQYCPDGVEYCPLNSLCSKITDGSHFSPHAVNEGYYMPSVKDMTEDNFIFDKCKKISKEDYEKLVSQGCKPEVNDVVIAKDGSMLRYVFSIEEEESIVLLSSIAILRPIIELVMPKYIVHCLRGESFRKKVIEKYSTKGGVPRIILKNFKMIEIPVPPLPVQEEIVRILDTFTELETELETKLETELELRQKQYEYYRDELLKFEGRDDVEWKPIGEIGEIVRGKRFVHKDDANEGVPAIHYGELYTHYGVSATSVKTHIRPELKPKMRYAHKGDVVIVGAGENKTDIGVAVAWLGNEDVAVHDACFILTNHNQCSRYLSYCLRTEDYHKKLFPFVSEGKICSFLKDGLAQVTIPIPKDISEQERIADLLDSFDNLVTDISEGLPAEIKMRHQQYEYYRDKLLTFKRLEDKAV